MMRIMLATVCFRFVSWRLVITQNFCSDFEHKVWSRFWSWCSGDILKLKFNQYFAADTWLILWSLILVKNLKLGLVKLKGKKYKKGISNDHNSLSQPCEHNCCGFQPFLGRCNGIKSVISHFIINHKNNWIINYNKYNLVLFLEISIVSPISNLLCHPLYHRNLGRNLFRIYTFKTFC